MARRMLRSSTPHRGATGRRQSRPSSRRRSWSLAPAPRCGMPGRRRPARPPVATFTIDMPAGWAMRVLDLVAVSPDSRYIAFTAVGPEARRALWVRPLAGGAPRRLVADGNPLSPFWSPDSSRIGFYQLGQLSAVSVADGSTQVLTVLAQPLSPSSLSELDVSDPLLGGAATWMDNGDILFTPVDRRGLRRLTRGAAAAVVVASVADVPALPQAIPGTDRFTLIEVRRGPAERAARGSAPSILRAESTYGRWNPGSSRPHRDRQCS